MWNVLHKASYKGRTARRKPFISKANKKNRLKFAKNFLDKQNSFWENVAFADESKFYIFMSDGVIKVWRRTNAEMPKNNLIQYLKSNMVEETSLFGGA